MSILLATAGALLSCERDRSDHTIGPSNTFAGNLKRGAVVGACARERETDRNVHAAVKRVQLERDQSLIVIHAKDGIELAFDSAMEDRVGGMWTSEDE